MAKTRSVNTILIEDKGSDIQLAQEIRRSQPGASIVKIEPEADKLTRISALPDAVADAKATPIGTYALKLDEITKLVGSLRGVLAELVVSPGDADVFGDRCEAALRRPSRGRIKSRPFSWPRSAGEPSGLEC